MEDVNRIKLVLVEKKRTSKWLAEQLGVNPSTPDFGGFNISGGST